jgi:hypothetical protein
MDKYIAGKQWHVQCHAAVLPLAQRAKAWKKMLDLKISQPGGCRLFLVGANEQHEPLWLVRIKWEKRHHGAPDLFSKVIVIRRQLRPVTYRTL